MSELRDHSIRTSSLVYSHGNKKNIAYSNTGFTWFIDESARLMRELRILILVLSGSSIKV